MKDGREKGREPPIMSNDKKQHKHKNDAIGIKAREQQFLSHFDVTRATRKCCG